MTIKSKAKVKQAKPHALFSVSDKKGLDKFAKGLKELGFEIVSSGGTAEFLQKAEIKVTRVEKLTKYPHMLDGRVKTLHPKVHGGLLGMRDNPEHVKKMKENGIKNIDLLVVNLYQFERTVAKTGVTLEEAIENIDIGGPAMLRSSAKNFKDVTVVVDPSDYDSVLKEMEESGGATSLKTRFRLAKKVFQLTHGYDGAISRYLEKVEI